MNQDKYNDAWTKLLAARRDGNFEDVRREAANLAHEAKLLHKGFVEADQEQIGPCSHFMVVNGHCINCHEIIGATGN